MAIARIYDTGDGVPRGSYPGGKERSPRNGKDGVNAGDETDRRVIFSVTSAVGWAHGSRVGASLRRPRVLSLLGRTNNQEVDGYGSSED